MCVCVTGKQYMEALMVFNAGLLLLHGNKD